MSEVTTLAPASTGDLRRVGAHPDHWYPLAWSRELKRGRTLGRRFGGEPIVLVRARSGAVFALEDRCAHRQVPLHAGVVDGETLRCCYHGWTYDCTGSCIDVPYLNKARAPNGVRSFPCREQGGLIFVFPGSADRAAARPVPELPAASSPRYKTRRFGDEVSCHYSFLHENLMDMNHQFLHRRLMGDVRARLMASRTSPTGFEVDYTFTREGGKSHIGESAIFSSSGDGDLIMTVRTLYPYQTLTIRTDDGAPVMELWIVYVPLDREQRTNRTFGLLSIRKPRVPGAIHVMWPFICWFTGRIFAEDRRIVEHEQAAWDRQGGDWNCEIFPVIRELRGLLARCGAPLQHASA